MAFEQFAQIRTLNPEPLAVSLRLSPQLSNGFLRANKLPPFLQFPTSHSRPTFRARLRLSSPEAPQPDTLPFMAQYLISSFGFSPDRALRLAGTSHFSPIQTSGRPDAVVRFLKETGFTDSQINKLITWAPHLLSLSVDNTLEPNLHKLMAVGVTGQTLVRLIQFSPTILWNKSAVSRVQFWRDYTGNDDAFLKTIHRNNRLLQLDIDKVISPTIKLLKDYGFSDAHVQKVWLLTGDVLTNVDSTKKLLEKTAALGFAPKSGMFLLALPVVARMKGETIVRKLEFLRNSYGWSDAELQTAFQKFPCFVRLSEDTLKSKIDFLVGSAGLTNQDISSRPVLLGFSLEGRLVPRYHVLKALKHKGLNISASFCYSVMLSEKNFLEKCVWPYKTEIPELEELYDAACLGKLSI